MRPWTRVADRIKTVSRSWWWTTIPGQYNTIWSYDSTTRGPQPMVVSASTALAVSTVYSCLRIFGDLIGTMPVRRYRGEFEQLDPPPFIVKPAGLPVGWTVELGQAIWSLLLRGNAYLIATQWDSTGYPSSFYVADPDAMTVDLVDGYRVRYRYKPEGAVEQTWIDPSPIELLHIPWQVPPGYPQGVGVLDAQGGPAGLLTGAAATQAYATDLMQNPIPPFAIEHPQRLDKPQAEELQAQWQTSVGRARAVPAVLSGGIKLTPLMVTPADVQLIESRRQNATDIANLFGIPPNYVGGSIGESMTYTTVEGENGRLWTNALQPLAIRLERYIGGAWTANGQRIKFVPDVVLRPLTKDRYDVYKVGIDAGVLTVDEARALEDRPPIPESEQPSQPSQPSQPTPALPPAPAMLPEGGTNG